MKELTKFSLVYLSIVILIEQPEGVLPVLQLVLVLHLLFVYLLIPRALYPTKIKI